MSAVFILLPLALLFVGIALGWFVWAVRSGQYDDLETPAVRVLFDDEPRADEPRPDEPHADRPPGRSNGRPHPPSPDPRSSS